LTRSLRDSYRVWATLLYSEVGGWIRSRPKVKLSLVFPGTVADQEEIDVRGEVKRSMATLHSLMNVSYMLASTHCNNPVWDLS
jgi:hypothetical protein